MVPLSIDLHVLDDDVKRDMVRLIVDLNKTLNEYSMDWLMLAKFWD
jgi:hypothetical protein